MKARLAKGMRPDGRPLFALIVESEDGLLVCSVMMSPEDAVKLVDEMRRIAVEMSSGLILPSRGES